MDWPMPLSKCWKQVILCAGRSVIVGRGDDFTRCLTEKLLTYALGRELEFGDRAVIDTILSNLAENDGGFYDLICFVVQSFSFGKN